MQVIVCQWNGPEGVKITLDKAQVKEVMVKEIMESVRRASSNQHFSSVRVSACQPWQPMLGSQDSMRDLSRGLHSAD